MSLPSAGRRLAPWLVAVFAVLLVAAPTAWPAETFVPAGSFSGAGSDPGLLASPAGVAVEPSTGNVLVADSGNGRVQVFDAAGGFVTEFGTPELDAPTGIAIRDVLGETVVYVSDPGTSQIVRYESDELLIPSFTLDGTWTSPAAGAGAVRVGDFGAALATAPNGDLWVADPAEDRLQRYDAAGGFLSSIDGSDAPGGAFTGLLDVAVDSTGDVLAVDANGRITGQPDGSGADGQSRVEQFSASGVHEQTLEGLNRPAAVAVDPATDEIAVSGDQDAVDGDAAPTLHVFDPSGDKLHELRMAAAAIYNTVQGLAFDPTGPTIWAVNDVAYWGGSQLGSPGLHRFELATQPTPTVESVDPGTVTQTSAAFAGTVDPEGDTATTWRFEVSPDGGSSWGVVDSDFDGDEGPLASAEPVADTATDLQHGTDYLVRLRATASTGASAVSASESFTTEAIPPPTVTLGTPQVVDGEARLSGSVDPHGTQVYYRFEYSTDGGGSWTAVDPDQDGDEDAGAGAGPEPVTATIPSLEPATGYQVRIVAYNYVGGETIEGPESFTTDAQQPGAMTSGANSPTATSVRLTGYVNPRNQPAGYHFEWGRQPDLSDAESLPASEDGDAGTGNRWNLAAETLGGLQPNATYHYRLVATRAGGDRAEGETRSFKTYPTPAPEPAYAGPPIPGRGFLPDNRGWELVSQVDLNGTMTTGGKLSENGDRAVYTVWGGAPGSTSSVQANHRADRGLDGWTSRPLDPPRSGTRYARVTAGALSPDLSRAFGVGAMTGGPVPVGLDLIRMDTDAPASFETLAARDRVGEGTNATFASDDLGTVVVDWSGFPLSDGGPAGYAANQLYEVGSGEPVFIGTLPDGTMSSLSMAANVSALVGADLHWLADDGSSLFFRALRDDGTVGIYVRVAGAGGLASPDSEVVRLDEPVGGSPETGNAGLFVQATPDGSVGYFWTDNRAVAGDDNGRGDLYSYSVATESRACLTCGVVGADIPGSELSLRVAQDGSAVYFASDRALVPEAVGGAPNLYAITGGGLRLVAHVGEFPDITQIFSGQVSVTPDGKTLLFAGRSSMLDEATGVSGGGHFQTYRYDLRSDSLACVSCPAVGAAVGTSFYRTWLGNFMQVDPRRAMSDDGDTVVFATETPLVATDVNGQSDVYRWREGRGPALITDGVSSPAGGADGTIPLEVSADGSSILFVANVRLTPEVLADEPAPQLYVARVGGGFAAPDGGPVACDGDGCQVRSPGPAAREPGSVGLRGDGDLEAARAASLRVAAIGPDARARLARGQRVSLRVRVSRPGVVRLVGRARIGRRTLVVARSSTLAREAGVVRVPLRLSRSARRALASGRQLRIGLSVRFAGQEQRRTLRLAGRRSK